MIDNTVQYSLWTLDSGTHIKKVVASIAYAPADRFFCIEFSRVTEATTCGFLMILLFFMLDESDPEGMLIAQKLSRFYPGIL